MASGFKPKRGEKEEQDGSKKIKSSGPGPHRFRLPLGSQVLRSGCQGSRAPKNCTTIVPKIERTCAVHFFKRITFLLPPIFRPLGNFNFRLLLPPRRKGYTWSWFQHLRFCVIKQTRCMTGRGITQTCSPSDFPSLNIQSPIVPQTAFPTADPLCVSGRTPYGCWAPGSFLPPQEVVIPPGSCRGGGALGVLSDRNLHSSELSDGPAEFVRRQSPGSRYIYFLFRDFSTSPWEVPHVTLFYGKRHFKAFIQVVLT